MEFDVGDLVTRKSHNNDTVFSITDIIDGIYYLSGLNVRLIADAFLEDLVKYEDQDVDDESSFLERIKIHEDLDRTDYFYLPGKILHIDADNYLNNNALNPYKIRKKAKNKSYRNNKIKQKIGNFS